MLGGNLGSLLYGDVSVMYNLSGKLKLKCYFFWTVCFGSHEIVILFFITLFFIKLSEKKKLNTFFRIILNQTIYICVTCPCVSKELIFDLI